MDYTLVNIIIFLLATIAYYNAPTPNVNTFSGGNNYTYLATYVCFMLIFQLLFNIYIVKTTCGGSVAENLGPAVTYTLGPWILIFGIVVASLNVFPGFKSAFSDVIGYMRVAGGTKKLLDDLLINVQPNDATVDAKISEKDIQVATPVSEKSNGDLTTQAVSDMIVKIYGDSSLLINQIVPSNFNKYWNILQPLMKPEYRGDDNALGNQLKDKFFKLVYTRDKIGECMWYIYTGILVVSIVQLNIATGGCVSNPATMAERNKQFLEAKDTAEQKQKMAASTTYTIAA
jgi:hypothetical protein